MRITVTDNQPWVVPEGRWMMIAEGHVSLQARTDGTWRGGNRIFGGGMVVSDGENVRLMGTAEGDQVLHFTEV
ncbi:MAG TPA: hypothetical protein VMX15_00875 [Candidatus Heimdallarchaeota archaeon]|nr:hypothetical protein [Candidatus Heimdallarchaeota archaeon]